jgi:hypothetical protein
VGTEIIFPLHGGSQDFLGHLIHLQSLKEDDVKVPTSLSILKMGKLRHREVFFHPPTPQYFRSLPKGQLELQ